MSKPRRNGNELVATYTPEQTAELGRLEADVRVRLAPIPKRLAHSISVAQTAERLALLYDVSPFEAKAAGLLHDWDKVLTHEQVIDRASALGIDMGVDLSLVQPLLHGMVAARELPERYPELSGDVFQAIDRHTTAAADMTPLDMVVFVADGIEPLRKGTPGIEESRSLVGKATLEELFWDSFVGGIIYVLRTNRYLYSGTLDIYNEISQEMNRQRENA